MTGVLTRESDTFVHSYLFLRRAIGVIGMALPFVLVFGVGVESGAVLSSISGYYYSDMRDIFVGSMCAIGIFLICYRGPARIDDVLSGVAGVAAVCVALFPTRPAGPVIELDATVGYLHVVFAGVFFLALAAFCLFLFTKPDRDQEPDPQRKAHRNRIYVGCGLVILVCLGLMALFGWVLEDEARALHPALWLESTAIFAFGVSWLVKGRTLLRDR